MSGVLYTTFSSANESLSQGGNKVPYFKATKLDEDNKTNRVLYIYAESLAKAEQALADRGVPGYSDFRYHSERRAAVPDNARCIGSPEQHPTYISPIFETSGQVMQAVAVIALGVCFGMLGYSIVVALIGLAFGASLSMG